MNSLLTAALCKVSSIKLDVSWHTVPKVLHVFPMCAAICKRCRLPALQTFKAIKTHQTIHSGNQSSASTVCNNTAFSFMTSLLDCKCLRPIGATACKDVAALSASSYAACIVTKAIDTHPYLCACKPAYFRASTCGDWWALASNATSFLIRVMRSTRLNAAHPISRCSCFGKLLKCSFRVFELSDDWSYCFIIYEGTEDPGLPELHQHPIYAQEEAQQHIPALWHYTNLHMPAVNEPPFLTRTTDHISLR